MDAIRQLWRQLAPREQRLVGGGAALLLVVLLVFYVWQPLERERARLRAGMPGMQAEAQMMRESVAEVARLRQGRKSPAHEAGGLRQVVEQAAATHGILLGQVMQENGGRLRISLASVPFDSWVKWLGILQAQHAIRLDSCQVDALSQSGMVKVQAVLGKV